MRGLEALLVGGRLTAWVAGFVRGRRRRRAGRTGGLGGVPSRRDATTLVQLERPGERPVTLHELPPAMDSIDFGAHLRVAREDAEAQAAELNRR